MLAKFLCAVALLLRVALADDEVLENRGHHRQLCSGVFGPKDKTGPYEPAVDVEFPAGQKGEISVVIFNFLDYDTLGTTVKGNNGQSVKKYLCDDEALRLQLCSKDDFGKIIIGKYSGDPKYEILREKIEFPHDKVTYKVKETGYYCVATLPLTQRDMNYKVKTHFMNAYGHLPASQLPLLLFHAVTALAYLLLLAGWGYLYFQYRDGVLPVQRYITGLAVFMFMEQVLVWGYLKQYNNAGVGAAGTRAYLVVIAILGALRLTLTFYLILIVSMGYSVVFSSLGPRMKLVRWLAVGLFVSSAVYSLDVYALLPDDQYGTLGFFLSLPAVILVGVFYLFTLHSLQMTTQYLTERKQNVKARMYKTLWWILLGSAIAVFSFFILMIVIQAAQSLKDYINNYWKTKWLLSDGWPNIVYFIAFAAIMFVWRPTANNRQFAMSTQLAQDEGDAEEFEIGSLNGSDYDEDAEDIRPTDEEAQRGNSAGVRRTAQSVHNESMYNEDNHSPALSDLEEPEDSDTNGTNWHRNQDREGLVDAPSGRLQ